MQRPKQEGLGAAFGGGMTDQMFGAQTTTVLQRGTVWCATLFFILALTLAILIGKKNGRIVSMKEAEEAATAAAEAGAEGSPEEISEALRSLIEEMESAGEGPQEGAPAEETPTEDAPTEENAPEGNAPEEESSPRDAEEETPEPEEDSEES